MLDVAIVQAKPRKGDLAANFASLRETFAQLRETRSPDLVVLPEAATTGYFLEGAVYDLSFTAQAFADRLAGAWDANERVEIVCGFYENDAGTFYNSALYATIDGGRAQVGHVHRKMFLPTYGVFDEERFLSRGRSLRTFDTSFGRAAILICEDVWHAIMPTIAAIKGARFLIIPSASPGRGLGGTRGVLESTDHWHELLAASAVEHGIYVIYAGLTGFEGGKGMSGASCVFSPRGELLVQAPQLEPCIVRIAIDPREIDLARATLPLLGDLGAVLPDLLLDAELTHPRHDAFDRPTMPEPRR